MTLVSAPAGFGKTTLLAEWLDPSGRRRPPGGLAVARRRRPRSGDLSGVRRGGAAAVPPGPAPAALDLLASSPAADRAGPDGAAERPRVDAGRGVAGARRLPPRRRPARSATAMRFLLEHLPAARARGDRHPRRPGLPAVPAAGARRAGRDPCRRTCASSPSEAAAYLDGQRPGPRRPRTSPPWRRGPRGGSPRCSSPRSRCGGARTSSGFIAAVRRATTGTSSTTSSRRCWRTSRTTVRDFLLRTVGPRPAHRRRSATPSPGRRRRRATCSPPWSGRTCSSSPLDDRRGVVPLPPPVRRRAAGAPAQRAAGRSAGPAPPRQRLVRAARLSAGRDRARAGREGLRPRGPPHGSSPRRRSDGTGRTRSLLGWLRRCPRARSGEQPGAQRLRTGTCRMLAGDLDGAEERLDDAEGVAAVGAGRGSGAPWAEADELRTLPATIAIYRASLAQAHGRRRRARRSTPGTALRPRRPATTIWRAAARPGSWVSPPGRGATSPSPWRRSPQAVASLHAAGNLVDELSSTVVLADMWVAAGRPGQARRLYEDALRGRRAARKRGWHARPPICTWDRASSTLEAGDRDARGPSPGGRVRCPRTPRHAGEPLPVVRRAGGAGARGGRPQDAIGFLDRGGASCIARASSPTCGPSRAMRARIRIAQGDLQAAADWARERGVSPPTPVEYLREFEHLTLARLLLASGAPERCPRRCWSAC